MSCKRQHFWTSICRPVSILCTWCATPYTTVINSQFKEFCHSFTSNGHKSYQDTTVLLRIPWSASIPAWKEKLWHPLKFQYVSCYPAQKGFCRANTTWKAVSKSFLIHSIHYLICMCHSWNVTMIFVGVSIRSHFPKNQNAECFDRSFNTVV